MSDSSIAGLIGRTATTNHGEHGTIIGAAHDPARCRFQPDAQGTEFFTPRIDALTLDPRPEALATTRRAEEIRESTGVPWETACARAELERDLADPAFPATDYDRSRLGWAAGLIPADHPQLWSGESLRAAYSRREALRDSTPNR
jgi:hypothetical protein